MLGSKGFSSLARVVEKSVFKESDGRDFRAYGSPHHHRVPMRDCPRVDINRILGGIPGNYKQQQYSHRMSTAAERNQIVRDVNSFTPPSSMWGEIRPPGL
ncbi:unnamed protein product [Protopolystoma xenopodis]|uniref:Uncharacterized protein n=1 Tax=Protopolystoma xenopodis TaxID=117903 RepID=A0A448WNT9_9PLAT|nr:unnamed protein product [Protopolystoma xenopodis]